MNPKISVIMPVFNGDKYLEEAIKSILNQTFKDFELIIINDGSTDNTAEVLSKVDDRRIIVLENKTNKGLVYSLNKGLNQAQGEYIARCDSDDIMRKDRLEKQFLFLQSNKEYVLVGSNTTSIDENGNEIGNTISPDTDQKIRLKLIIRNYIQHPSVMYRTNSIKKIHGYRKIFNLGGEDYDLWFRMLRMGKFYNIQENLTKRRFHDQVYTKQHHLRIESLTLLVRLLNFPNYLSSLFYI